MFIQAGEYIINLANVCEIMVISETLVLVSYNAGAWDAGEGKSECHGRTLEGDAAVEFLRVFRNNVVSY